MWRLLLVLLPVIVYFAVDWNQFVKEPAPTPKPFYVTSPSYGVYEHEGHKGTLGTVLDKIQAQHPDRTLAISMHLKYPARDDLNKATEQLRKTITGRGGVVSALSFMPTQQIPDYSQDIKACEALVLTEENIRSIIAQSPLVRAEVWKNHHNVAPCRHDGQIDFQGKLREYSYYPTGYMWLEGYDGWLMCYDCSIYPEWIAFDGKGKASTTNGAEYKESFKDQILAVNSTAE